MVVQSGEPCLVMWGYHIRPECIGDFERIYSATGDWADLLRQAPG